MFYQQFLGIPFKFRGRDRSGTDCLGLVWMYLRSKGIRIPDGDGLPMEKDLQPDYLDRAIEGLSRCCESVAQPQANDIILMKLPGGYTHMGVMVDEENMLHVLKDRPSGLEPVQKYRRRVVAIFRPKRWRLFGGGG
ncbi:MAG: NlpC/P60 family protein [Bacillota bacterium]